MSRNDRRGNRNHGYRNERNNQNERNDRERGSRNERRFEQNRHFAGSVSQKEIQERESAIRAFKENAPVCELCNQPINDVANAISNKNTDNPVHFDCVLSKLSETEKLGQNEKLSYIGQGRFAVLHFANPHDAKHFEIKKIIEWEEREKKRGQWRDEMAGLFSQVK